MTEIAYGAKYERGRDITEIAKLVRADIKAAIKAGDLPKGTKCSVRVSRFSGGRSLTVTVKALPGINGLNWYRLDAEKAEPHQYPGNFPQHARAIYSPEGTRVVKLLEAMVEAYNFDGSDTQTDYFHVNFYKTIDFDYDLEKAWRAEWQAADRDPEPYDPQTDYVPVGVMTTEELREESNQWRAAAKDVTREDLGWTQEALDRARAVEAEIEARRPRRAQLRLVPPPAPPEPEKNEQEAWLEWIGGL